jgi:hypothetical protein
VSAAAPDLGWACRVLGLGRAPTWAEVRVAYRAQIASAHPDRAGGDTERAAVVNEAYAVLERAHRQGALGAVPASPSTSPPAAPAAAPRWEPLDEPPEVLEGDTVHLAVPPDEAFGRLVEAGHRIGAVTYVDRSCSILEVLVRVEGEGTCSLLVTTQGRAEGTDAFCTLEAIEHVASPPVRPVVEALVEALRRG